MINLARVVATHWDAHTVDLVMVMDGRPVNGVRVMSPMASTNTGLADLPDPVPVSADKALASGGASVEREMIAVVAHFNNLPVVIGFLHPVETQMIFADKERMVYRHASDVYQTIDKDGNFEFSHPGGAYIRIGTTSAHEDLTGKDVNAAWKIKRNTDKQVHIHVEQANGKATLDIAPDGAIAITTATTVSVNATGDATVTSGGNVSVTAAGTAKVQAGGKATVKGASIDLDAGAMKGIVQGDCACAFTGLPHGQVSATVKGSV
jgi:hypothetical protein